MALDKAENSSVLLSPICWLRGLWYSFRVGGRTHGHSYRLLDAEPDQACCVHNYQCMTCGYYFTGWESCACKRRSA